MVPSTYLWMIWIHQFTASICILLTSVPYLVLRIIYKSNFKIIVSSVPLNTALYIFITIVECSLQRWSKLPPQLFLVSHVAKSVPVFQDIYWACVELQYAQRYHWYNTLPVQSLTLELFLFHYTLVGVAYGSYVLVSQRVLQQQRDGIVAADSVRASSLANQQEADWVLPLRLSQWAWMHEHTPGAWISWIPLFVVRLARCLLVQPLNVLCLGALSRLPGEYTNDKMSDYPLPWAFQNSSHPAIDEWQYAHELTDPPSSTLETDAQSTYSLHQVMPDAVGHPQNTAPSATADRLLRPRYLCVVDETQPRGFRVVSTSDDIALFSLQYVFISYTRRQFYTQMAGDPSLTDDERRKRNQMAEQDAGTLLRTSIDAARHADTKAFWIDFECVQPESPEHADATKSMQDVYRICDVVRAAKTMAIVVGPPLNDRYEHTETDSSDRNKLLWLREWGGRLWTLPEALLCPRDHGIMLWYLDGSNVKMETVEKRNLAPYVWDDAAIVGQLIDHYEGSVHLSQLELLVIALGSLQRRQTVARSHADAIYALMGLMRERVMVRTGDSAFQAFARLSLVNDSDKPLERLLCLRPPTHTGPWHTLKDAWGANLWDITPDCQIAEVCDDDAVVLGDLCGTRIDWGLWKPVDFVLDMGRPGALSLAYSHGRASSVAGYSWTLQLMALVQMAIWPWSRALHEKAVVWAMTAPFAFLLAILLFFYTRLILLPRHILRFYDGDVNKIEARICGFEGAPELQDVEKMMFGLSRGHLSWASRTPVGPRGVGDDVYTLVDTGSMKAYVFRASTRPYTLMVCGRQGGLLRALLCSYNHAKGRYHKEAVLRMDTKILQRMSRMDLCRVSLSPQERYRDVVGV